MQLPQESIMRHVPARKSDEDDRATRLPKELNFGERRVLFRLLAEPVIGIEEDDIRAVECLPLACSPCASLDAERHGFAME